MEYYGTLTSATYQKPTRTRFQNNIDQEYFKNIKAEILR